MFPHRHWSNQIGIAADKRVILYHSLKFVLSVIIDGDGTTTEIYPLPNLCVADICSMGYFCIVADYGFLDLHKIADLDMASDITVRADIGKWPYHCISADFAVIDNRF